MRGLAIWGLAGVLACSVPDTGDGDGDSMALEEEGTDTGPVTVLDDTDQELVASGDDDFRFVQQRCGDFEEVGGNYFAFMMTEPTLPLPVSNQPIMLFASIQVKETSYSPSHQMQLAIIEDGDPDQTVWVSDDFHFEDDDHGVQTILFAFVPEHPGNYEAVLLSKSGSTSGLEECELFAFVP